jgi:hypothetical protein
VWQAVGGQVGVVAARSGEHRQCDAAEKQGGLLSSRMRLTAGTGARRLLAGRAGCLVVHYSRLAWWEGVECGACTVWLAGDQHLVLLGAAAVEGSRRRCFGAACWCKRSRRSAVHCVLLRTGCCVVITGNKLHGKLAAGCAVVCGDRDRTWSQGCGSCGSCHIRL